MNSICLIDNYDSFTYNLFQYVGAIRPDVRVIRNDGESVEAILAERPSHIILSPGPGYPAQAGICIPLIRENRSIPLLGVCLGHQAVGEAFGGRVVPAPRIVHGKADRVQIDRKCPLFAGMDGELEAGRYHSLAVEETSLPAELTVTARSRDGCIMGLAHRERPIFGIQFHPESVLTPKGMEIIRNFLSLT